MRLKQEQFVPFMIAIAFITMVIIVYSAFRFNHKQYERFTENIAESDSLTVMAMPVAGADGHIRLDDYRGQKTILVFWASWSGKSQAMMDEIKQLKVRYPELQVVAALVKDAEESFRDGKAYPSFTYTDGVQLYNHLRVPGFPSYILFDENQQILHSRIGYEKGVGYDSLTVYFK